MASDYITVTVLFIAKLNLIYKFVFMFKFKDLKVSIFLTKIVVTESQKKNYETKDTSVNVTYFMNFYYYNIYFR